MVSTTKCLELLHMECLAHRLSKVTEVSIAAIYCILIILDDVRCKVVICGGMEHSFLSQKGSGGGKGVKEKNPNRNKTNTTLGMGVSTESDDTMNEDTPVGVASAAKVGVTPSMVDLTVDMDKLSSLEDTTVLGSFPPLSMPDITMAGNAPGKSLYANVTGKPSGKKLNIHTLFTQGGNGIEVVVPVAYPVVANYVRNTWGKYGLVHSMFSSSTKLFSFQFISMEEIDAMLENGPWFIQNNLLILKKWHPDENLLKEDVSTILVWVKLHGVPVTAFSEDGLSAIATKLGTPLMLDSYTSDIYMQSWGRSSCARVMTELRADEELKDNIVVAMPKITREGHYICNFGTNGGNTNLVNNEATSSGSSFMNVDNSNTSTTPIIDKIGKFEELLTSGQAILLDEAGNPMKKVEFSGDYDSEDEVASVDNDMARSLALKRVGFGTQSLLEQWRDSYGNGDYDEDPYDDDMYEGQDLSQEILAICDNLDIRVRGCKKK
ncbi:putative ribonuclease H-like domain-containing protein [Tanacetum coccineum]